MSRSFRDEVMSITAENGVRFNARILREGDQYGTSGTLFWEHEDRPGVEFYDARHGHTDFGQFVSRYFVETILEGNPARGLDLYGGEPSWTIDGRSMLLVRQWLHHETAR